MVALVTITPYSDFIGISGKMTRPRVLAVDPGEKRIGLAISDESRTIASPMGIIKHVSRADDAREIIRFSEEREVGTIVIGCALDMENEISFQGRKSVRLADCIRQSSSIPVVLWDESESTRIARETRREMSIKKTKQRGHQDDLAAAVILQTFLDAHSKKE